MKWFKRRKAGLTEDDIRGVRNKFIQLYLEPGESIETAPPMGRERDAPVSSVRLSGSTTPCFEFSKTDLSPSASIIEPGSGRIMHPSLHFRFWLKFPTERFPHWDLQINDAPQIDTLDFADPSAAIPIALVKAFAIYWPFFPAENHLLNGGAELI